MSEKTELKDFIKSQSALKRKTLTEVAKKIGRSQSRISTRVNSNNLTVSMFVDILAVLGEDFTIVLKDGSTHTIKT